MLYNVVLASTAQQNESAIHIQISPPFWTSLPLGYHSVLGRDTCATYSKFASVVYFIHSISNVYVSIPLSQFLPPHPFPPWYPYIRFLCLCLYFCFADKFICILFLDSIYKRYHTVFVFLTYFTLYDSL